MYSTREENFIEVVIFKLGLKRQKKDHPSTRRCTQDGSKGEPRGREQTFHEERTS